MKPFPKIFGWFGVAGAVLPQLWSLWYQTPGNAVTKGLTILGTLLALFSHSATGNGPAFPGSQPPAPQ